jgi:hypothetical protein
VCLGFSRGLAKSHTLQKLSKHFPDVVCQQDENAANATNPEEKVGGQLGRIDLLFVHRRRVTPSEGYVIPGRVSRTDPSSCLQTAHDKNNQRNHDDRSD